MTDPIDRHVEAADIWEDLQDEGPEGSAGSALDAMAMLTSEWAAASELATQRMRAVYDKVRPGPEPDKKN